MEWLVLNQSAIIIYLAAASMVVIGFSDYGIGKWKMALLSFLWLPWLVIILSYVISTSMLTWLRRSKAKG